MRSRDAEQRGVPASSGETRRPCQRSGTRGRLGSCAGSWKAMGAGPSTFGAGRGRGGGCLTPKSTCSRNTIGCEGVEDTPTHPGLSKPELVHAPLVRTRPAGVLTGTKAVPRKRKNGAHPRERTSPGVLHEPKSPASRMRRAGRLRRGRVPRTSFLWAWTH